MPGMSNKHLVIIGTAHEFQLDDDTKNPWTKEFRAMLLNVMKSESDPVEIILEEWADWRGTSIGKNLESDNLKWHKINPPTTSEYKTDNAGRIGHYGPDAPCAYLSLPQHPFEPHELRESYMVNSVIDAMGTRSNGLIIVGMAHIHSLMAKLRAAGFEVIAGTWLQLCDKGQKIMQE